jgi:hypothetical protein
MAWTSPRTWVAGETVTAALMNTHVRDNMKAQGDAWTAFTPTFSGAWTLGNGTLEGWYMKMGRYVTAKVKLTVGSTTAPSGNFGLTLPWTHANGAVGGGGTDDGLPVGRAECFDLSAVGSFYRDVLVNSATLRIVDPIVTAAVPFTWATGDILFAQFTIEVTA